MFNTINKKLCLLIYFIACCFCSNSQIKQDTSIKKAINTYCYYPNDINKVSHNGKLNFYVSSFTSNNVGNIELLIQETGRPGPEIGGISFTIDGLYDTGKPMKFSWTSNNTVRINLSGYLAGKNYVSVYLNRVASATGIESAGPITFVSSNGGSNSGFATQCETENTKESGDKPDTSAKWSFKIPSRLTFNSGGPKNEVLDQALKDISLLPTDGMISLLEKLNPGLNEKTVLEPGYTIILPKFPEPDQTHKNQLEAQFASDVSVDPVQNAIFLERSKFLTTIIKAIEVPQMEGENKGIADDLKWVYNILLKLQNSQTGLKRNQTNLINSEIENFYNFLIEDFSRNGVTEESTVYIHGFRDYLSQVLRSPRSKSSPKNTFNGDGGPYSEDEQLSDEDQSLEFAGDPHEGLLKVYIYAFENEYSAPRDGYFIYWLSKFQHDRLTSKKTEIKMADLANITLRCNDPASPASTQLDPSFSYYFIAVSMSSGEIEMCNRVDLKTLSRDAQNKFINKPFGIPLYGMDKCF